MIEFAPYQSNRRNDTLVPLMKTKTALNVVLAALLCGVFSCSQPQHAASQVTTAIDSLKAHYAPDRRFAVFDVTCVQQGSVVILRGEVDNPKAKEDVMSLVHRSLGGQTIDSLKVLPDLELGNNRFGIVSVSVGNVHIDTGGQRDLDLERLAAIHHRACVPLVLHGGSGTPLEMIRNAIHLPGGGVSKVNIATDLELVLLNELGLKERITDAALRAFPPEALERSVQAVRELVEEKIVHFLDSCEHAADYMKG